MSVRESARLAKEAAIVSGGLSGEVKNNAVEAICDALLRESERIEKANALDLENAEREGLAQPLLRRLSFCGSKLADTVEGARGVTLLDDPCGRVLAKTELADGLILTKKSCPIGVIGVIFESRPDALVQIATLCVKSGNSAILKGGREAYATNSALADIIHGAGVKAGLPEGFITLLSSREETNELLECDDCVDLIIPRGSSSFVRYIMDNTKIPVMGHAEGICHVYLDRAADVKKAVDIVVDSKTQYPAACNSAETLLADSLSAGVLLPPVVQALKEKGVRVKGCELTRQIVDCEPAAEEDWATEYVDLVISVKIVDGVRGAVSHINKYGSGHTDCIVTEDDEAAAYFTANVDSAGVYRNCSTRFADGYRYGFGAEVGISTSKLHARGPVGIDGLVSYKYLLEGNGDTVAQFADGRKKFTHKAL